ncbi:MAG TPA: hypothetical protein VGL56_04650 [Fimbriimonadaceae bacterium]|jgi:hypothetical protein
MDRPLYVYDNWSTYDELSDNVPLTEELAMQQFHELLRLKKQGVKMDAYLMDAFWNAPDGGYIEWRKDRWPNGPEAWLAACKENDILPGLWFPANTNFHIEPPLEWRDSLAADEWGFCLFHGGFWKGFLEKLDYWYRQGVRVFKFDFADFRAATDELKLTMLPSQIRSRNIAAYRAGLLEFRSTHPESVFVAYNGFEEVEFMNRTDHKLRRLLDPAWLDVFDTIYCGDPRPADAPLPNFWRTLDVYADHMVRFLNLGGLSLDQIDNCAFMIGRTGTCCRRGNADWKTTLLLSLARGGKVHMTLGNLEALSDEDGKWFARVQNLFESEKPDFVGGLPGLGELYGYQSMNLLTLVNPSLEAQLYTLPEGFEHQIYSDGFVSLETGTMTLGTGAMAVLGKSPVELGSGENRLTYSFKIIEANWKADGRLAEAAIPTPSQDLHILFRQKDARENAVRTSGGAPPSGKPIPELLKISVKSTGQELKVDRPDDHIIWSGLSWAWGILPAGSAKAGDLLTIRLETSDLAVSQIFPSLLSANHR